MLAENPGQNELAIVKLVNIPGAPTLAEAVASLAFPLTQGESPECVKDFLCRFLFDLELASPLAKLNPAKMAGNTRPLHPAHAFAHTASGKPADVNL